MRSQGLLENKLQDGTDKEVMTGTGTSEESRQPQHGISVDNSVVGANLSQTQRDGPPNATDSQQQPNFGQSTLLRSPYNLRPRAQKPQEIRQLNTTQPGASSDSSWDMPGFCTPNFVNGLSSVIYMVPQQIFYQWPSY